MAKVNAIREEAMAKGWREARLYQNSGRFRFPCGEDYGLVCFVDGEERIGEVTRESIEIVGPPPREITLRFDNSDVEQPWHRTNRQDRRFGRAEGALEGREPGMASVKSAGTH